MKINKSPEKAGNCGDLINAKSFMQVSKDERRIIYANQSLLKDSEISIIKLKKGKAIGGCQHSKDEYFAILDGCVLVSNGVENIVGMAPDAGTFRANTPHAFYAEEDSLIMEWGISAEEKINSKKDLEMEKRVKEFNLLR